MDLYGQQGRSIPQKTVIIVLEILLIWLSWWIMFQAGGKIIFTWLGIQKPPVAIAERKWIIFIFSIVIFIRLGFMMLFLLKRKIPWEESISVPIAFALYYIGFALLVLPSGNSIDLLDYLGIILFVKGCFLNTFGELQRYFWKKNPMNKGKLFTKGLFAYSMHINYFGDVLWVSGYALITRNYYAILIPLFLFSFFAFYNIPKLDKYLALKYKEQFQAYRKKTKRFIPFIW